MRQIPITFIIVLAAAILTGCSASSKGGTYGKGSGDGSFSDQDLLLEEQNQAARWGDGSTIPEAQSGGLFADIFFGYDSSTIAQEYLDQLKENAKVLTSNPALKVEIEGHCDKRGTTEYNLVLGEERAKSVANVLLSYGVLPEQMSIISYGEEIPIDPGDTESAFVKNRRVHLVPYKSK